MASSEPLHWSPFDTATMDPYPMFKRLREEAPIYYNERYDFYALSRYDDCENCLFDRDTYSSAYGGVVDIIKANIDIPSGMFIFEDPPRHTVHRSIFARMFTPRRLKALEPQIRDYCKSAIEPLVKAGKFDFVADLGGQMPMRVIAMLLGIPESDTQAVREKTDAGLRYEDEEMKDFTPDTFANPIFNEYLDWREKHPSDDVMTELLAVEFQDENGVTRRLTRNEMLIVLNLLATAGNETTNKLISWTGKVLAEHPDQRRQIQEDRSLITQTIEEVLRYEPPSGHIARVNMKDVEFYGVKIPKGSAIAMLVPAGNRDERAFPNPDAFDIHRERKPHLTFGYAWHVCLGNQLARLEGRVMLDELLNSMPEWTVDMKNAQLMKTSTVRGFETLPAFVG